MTKHPFKGSLNFCSNHFDPQKEEQLKCMKMEIEDQVQKVLKLTKSINHGNKERNLRKKAEAMQLIADFLKQYESLYTSYEDLRQEVKKNFIDDSSSASISDSESYYSPEELDAAKSNSSSDNSKVDNSYNLESENSDLDETILKDKLTSSREVKKTMDLDSEGGEINQVKDLEGEVASLKLEISTLCAQKSELEEQVKCKFDELTEMEDKISMMGARIMELEAASEENDCRFDLLRNEYEDNEKSYSSRISVLVAQAHEMEVEVSSLKQQKRELDELLKCETTRLSSQVKGLMEQLYTLQQKLISNEREKQGLKVEVNDLEREIDTLRHEKSYLVEEVRKISQEALQEKEKISILHMELEKEKQESCSRESHLKKKNNELEEVISKLRDENEQAQSGLLYSRSNYRIVERKLDEMAEEFRKQFEDKYRILSRRIRVAEQLHMENKEGYRKTKEAYEEKYKELQERTAKNEVELKHVKDLTVTANDVLASLDSVALKFEEYTANFLNRISKASCELKFAKHWATRKNKALLHVKDDLDCLLRQLDDKDAEILVFREKVWKLEK